MKITEALEQSRWSQAKITINGEEITARVYEGRVIKDDGKLFLQFCNTVPLDIVILDTWEPVNPGPKITDEERVKFILENKDSIVEGFRRYFRGIK